MIDVADEMPAWQYRVYEERNELEQRLQKLNKFMATKEFAALPSFDTDLLNKQERHMRDYYDVLGQRICNFV